jgi:hypothetical protein
VVDQEESPAALGLGAGGKVVLAGMAGHTGTFILNLPDHPAGGHDPPHPQAFAGIAAVAVPHRVDEGLLQAQLKLGLTHGATDRFEQQLQQR